jgi:hypothetical protein
MDTQKSTHRKKVVFVPQDYVLRMFSGVFADCRCVRLPKALGLPDTARVVGVWEDFARASFAFVVEDPSFDEVPIGGRFPEIEVDWVVVE